MASIRPRTNKQGDIISYEIRVFRGRDAEGKQLKPFTMSWTPPDGWSANKAKREIAKVAALFEENCKKGNVSTERKNFAEYAVYVIDMKERNGAKHRTVFRYRSLLERIVDDSNCGIGHLKLQDIRADHLNTLYAKLAEPGQNKHTGNGLSAKTIIEHHRLISTVLSQAVKEQLIPQNIAQRATPPKTPKHEAECFELEEIQAIIEAANAEPIKWKAIINLLIATGARRGEIMGLQWKSVDFKTNQLYLCNTILYSTDKGIYSDTLKTGENRYVTVAPSVMQILIALKKEQTLHRFRMGAEWHDTGYLFTQENGKPMHPDSVTDWLYKFSKRHNLPHINPHKFRHTQASLLINQGVDIVSVSKRLGHAKVSTTSDIYAHILNKADEKASNVIDNLLYKQA